MNSIALNGLLGSHPLGALASFGLLRLISDKDSTARLHFEMQDDWIARIGSDSISGEDTLIEMLVDWINSEELTSAMDWADDARVQPAAYRDLLRGAIADGRRARMDMMSALVADGATDAQKGLIKPSAFYMVSGQQSFLGGLREILAQARKSPEAIIREAIFGPWRYQVRAHSLGWDPNTERLYALRSRAPTSEKPSCVAGAVLLSLWAMPLMPSLCQEGRAHTVGFYRRQKTQMYSWPVFSSPIALGDLKTLLQVGHRGWISSGRKRSGIEAVFESERFEFGQGYAVLRPAHVAG
ncbi:type I-G CRISPR-associated protein, Cas3-extension family [Povalibacter sp.]|uniref:type I-G CRISPR-associated protein, Cas3-extension family n=1 Tax=Povalibacter sp. TaxID=1962978 RepID=UPI002F3FF5DA